MLNDTAKEWGIEPRHVEEYIETLSRRAMNVHRVVQQNCTLVKQKPDKVKEDSWVLDLPWMDRAKVLERQKAAMQPQNNKPEEAPPAARTRFKRLAQAAVADTERGSSFVRRGTCLQEQEAAPRTPTAVVTLRTEPHVLDKSPIGNSNRERSTEKGDAFLDHRLL